MAETPRPSDVDVYLPRGDEPQEVQDYFNYLNQYFIDHLPQEQWRLDAATPLTELGFVVGIGFLLWGLAFVPRRQRKKGMYYPVSIYNEITERGGSVSKWQWVLYLVIVLIAGYYFVRTLTAGYVYEGA